jgi:hypothetical protein
MSIEKKLNTFLICVLKLSFSLPFNTITGLSWVIQIQNQKLQ